MLKSLKQTLITGGIATAMLVSGSIAAQAEMDGETRAKLAAVLGGDHRSADHRARDIYRNPAETLEFFGLNQDMTVVEVLPGGGWYTHVLAPTLAGTGKYYAGHIDPESSERAEGFVQRFKDMTSDEEIYGDVSVGVLTPEKVSGLPEGEADLVLTFRAVHGWLRTEGDAEKMFANMHSMLKAGGHLGVVQHRGNPNFDQESQGNVGYVNEGYIIKLAQDAGFEFVASSDVNHNPLDDKDYEKRVWRLPPTLRHFGGPNDGQLSEEDIARNTAIGESDRATLLFVKPAS